MSNLSLRTKLLAALLGVGLLALLVTGWQAYRRAETALRQVSINHLTSIREERKREIETYFGNVRRDGLTLAESRDITTAMVQFKAAFRDLEAQVPRWPEEALARYRSRVDRHYRSAFEPRLQGLESEFGADARRYFPAEDVALVLQALFIADNPNPEGSRDRLDRPSGGGRYSDVHARFNPFLRSTIRQFGYHDLFLIDHETSRVVYTVAKKVDFGTSLLSRPYQDTRLSRAFRAARNAIDADFVQISDFESYSPSLGAPAAFVAAPIFKDGRRLGVLALQIPLDRIDAVMTGDRKWEERGLGRTGETYLVGSDYRMRSDSRFFLEATQQYLQTISGIGVPAERVRLMQTHQSTVLFQEITTTAATAAVGGQTGTSAQLDDRGEQVLASYAPLAIPGLDWAIVAKLDTVEAFAPVTALRRALLGTGAAIAGLVVVVALVLARSLTAPIHRLIAGTRILGRGELSHRLAEGRRDEIGQIATALNRMAGELQETTVSRDHVTSILDSMGDAVIVVRPPDTGADWRDAVITTVNPAACTMLGRKQDEILGQPVGSLIPDITAGPSRPAGEGDIWLEEVLREGRIGSREVVYKMLGGREVPVLFSSAVMQQGANAVQDIVCAAHDLTEVKALEARGAFIRETFGRYVSDDVVASLLSSPEALKLGGELRKVTIMMSDLRGFTALAERLTPEEAVCFLNGYLQSMVDLILRYGGTINEIMGDGILVIFGAPRAAADDAERAVACGVAMQRAMDEVNERGRERGLLEVEMGIGIHTGEVIVGNIGSDRRMKYAAVGTHVNLTGRIESYTTGGQILISESTLQEVSPILDVGRALRIEPKGAKREMTVWEVVGIGGSHGLALRVVASPMVGLATAIPIRYAVLEEKLVGRTILDASFVRLSVKGAEVRSAVLVPPLKNLKIWLIEAGAPPVEFYAKVVGDPPASGPGFTVRFTSMAADVAEQLRRRLAI